MSERVGLSPCAVHGTPFSLGKVALQSFGARISPSCSTRKSLCWGRLNGERERYNISLGSNVLVTEGNSSIFFSFLCDFFSIPSSFGQRGLNRLSVGIFQNYYLTFDGRLVFVGLFSYFILNDGFFLLLFLLVLKE